MTTARTLRATPLAALALVAVASLASAQGLASDKAIEKIVGSEVDAQETSSVVATDNILAAIDRTAETTGKIRKASALDAVEIVFLSDAAASEGGPPAEIVAQLTKHKAEIVELRKESNAMLFHAVDSRGVLMHDIIAVEFNDDRHVTIYAASAPPS